MKQFSLTPQMGWLALLLVLTLWLAGCATNDENLAERPWNSPKGWEGGIPSNLYDRERQ